MNFALPMANSLVPMSLGSILAYLARSIADGSSTPYPSNTGLFNQVINHFR
jgi:hypothetical protein